ncbi:MAG: serine hydrolase domain-containing protein, partial [Ignavibacteria bacterium]|nr:serine hydrolase domain-containing protein [Ignavibacteria bacterium]
MKRFLLLFLLFGTTAIFAASRGDETKSARQNLKQTAAPEDVGFSSERLTRVDKYFSELIESNKLPHAQAFIARHGKVVYFKSFGLKDNEKKIPLQNSDIFRLASQSKAITTTALMILFEEAKVNLNDPVYKYIPAFKDVKVQIKSGTDYSTANLEDLRKPITIHHLLTHTSGIPYWWDPNVFKIIISPGYTFDNVTLEEVINEMAKMPLAHQPEAALTYGYNLDVVGRIIEVASGMKLDEFFKKRIFEPLGMNDTYFYLPQEKANRLANLSAKEKENEPAVTSNDDLFCNYSVKGARSFLSGGAGLVGPLEDYAKFCQMLLNGGSYNNKQIISPKSVETMTRNHVGALPLGDTGNQFGFGFEIMT